MSNTSESPDAKEQVKPATTRSRSTARAKTESATPDTQEQAAKPATRRRATSTGSATAAETSAAPARTAVATEKASPAPTADARPAPAPSTGSSEKPVTRRAAPAQQPTASTQTAAPAQRSTATPQPGRPAQTGTSAQRSTPVQQPNRPTQPGTSAQHSAPVQQPTRPAQPGTPVQRNTSTAQPNRPAPSGTPVQRGGYPQRSGGAVAPGQRPQQGSNGQRPGSGYAPRPSSGGHTAPGRAPSRGPQGHSGGARPTTPAQRPTERRVHAVKEKPTGPVAIPAQIVVKDLADLLRASPNEIISDLIKKHSIFANINQVIDYDKAALVATDLGFEPSQVAQTIAPSVQRTKGGLSANEAMIAGRDSDGTIVIPPVVTIMGHVDHGKTSLLDTIRKTKVAAGEVGGITQHIGAYQVEVQGKKITFLDTPGHEAFTAMRSRGAQVTHIAVIVVAADDGVMPQTREAIDHAKAAKVPIIIALNKMDLLNANPDYVKQQLAEIDVVVEEYGGDVPCIPVSARKGTGIDDLLEMILLVAEIQDIRANPNAPATGTIIEAKLEKNIGPTATALIQQGTLKMGDNIVVGAMAGKVRAMFNDRGKRIQKAPPSTPVSILGLPEVPQAGDRLEVVEEERVARQMAERIAEQRRTETMPLGQVSLDTLYMQMQEGTVKELDIVLKCDVQGSAEAIKHALSRVGDENLKVRLIHEGIGNISETDVHLAGASGAVVIGFNVKADGAAQRLAQKEGVDIRYYNIIYKLLDDIQAALTGMLEPTYREVIEGHAEVQQVFKAGKNLVIAGCRVVDGKITRSSQARMTRKEELVFDGKIASLRRGKDDVREVASGYECGIVLEDFNGFEVGDLIEAYYKERVKPGA
ncbi:MAG TPA: translation initiation factor IF-2 [Ktedonobacteraceae bacterium]|nr:translation initiation factor IF-2 [Ktedonobacteraceae bacterium]